MVYHYGSHYGHRSSFSAATPRSRIASQILARIENESLLYRTLLRFVCLRCRPGAASGSFMPESSAAFTSVFFACFSLRRIRPVVLLVCRNCACRIYLASCSVTTDSVAAGSCFPLMLIGDCPSGNVANGNFPIIRLGASGCPALSDSDFSDSCCRSCLILVFDNRPARHCQFLL